MTVLPPHLRRLAEFITRISPIPLVITIVCLGISLWKNEDLWHGYMISFTIWSALSLIGIWVKYQPEKSSYREQCFYFGMIWLLSAGISSFPFLFVENTGDFPDFSSAYFEAMSGYTSTGLTMVSDSSQLPWSIQLYRSLLQWVGGLGFALFAMITINRVDPIDSMLQASGLDASNKLENPRLIRAYLIVYVALTLFILIGLMSFSLPFWEAINHGLTIASTGGFGITANSLSNYSDHSLLFISFCLLLSALPFPVVYLVSRGKWQIAMKNSQVKSYFLWISIALCIGVVATRNFSPEIFNIVSAATTAGFSVGSPTSIHPVVTIMLIVLMIVGGASASTAGGIKINRFVWLLKGTKAYLQKKRGDYYFNKEFVKKSKAYKHIRTAALYLLCSLSIRGLGTVIILMIEPVATSSDVLFDTASAITTTGLSSGFTGSDIHWGSKWILSILMWMGRLEYQTISMFIIMLFFMNRSVENRNDINTK